MNENIKINENAIYAIIGIPKLDMDALENNKEFEGLLKGINGTCFFIAPDKFITAHHCLNQFYANDQIYFLINTNGHIINGIQIEFEDSKTDFCVGKINLPIATNFKLNNEILINRNHKFTAYGFSSNDTQNFRLKLIKVNDLIRILEHDSLTLKKVEYNCVKKTFLKSHISSDLIPIQLKDCNAIIFDKSVELGFSGGPTFSNDTGELIGFTSQDVILENSTNPFNLVIPVTANL